MAMPARSATSPGNRLKAESMADGQGEADHRVNDDTQLVSCHTLC